MRGAGLRADRWLWFARLFKSRTLAARACASRRIRRNGTALSKPNQALHVGDVLTFARGRALCVVRVVALGHRRGPVEEARALYEDLRVAAEVAAPLGRPPARRRGGRARPNGGRSTGCAAVHRRAAAGL